MDMDNVKVPLHTFYKAIEAVVEAIVLYLLLHVYIYIPGCVLYGVHRGVP